MAEKPSVLIIGGLGYVGRFLALHIHKNNLASEVRIVDKVLPQLAWLPAEFNDACSPDKFVQADASRERTCPLRKRDGAGPPSPTLTGASRVYDPPGLRRTPALN